MYGENMTWIWGTGLIIFVIGLGLGVLVAYLFGGHRRLRAKNAELQEIQAAYTSYRKDVDHHFHKTGELLQQMTGQYRSIYEHLAQGAHTLGDARWQPPMLDLAEPPNPEPIEPRQNDQEEAIFAAEAADGTLDEAADVSEIDLAHDSVEPLRREYH
ncbi:MAG: DUF1043 family protein [Gammaproteobacteria bacterium]